jgi:hypothetical protein
LLRGVYIHKKVPKLIVEKLPHRGFTEELAHPRRKKRASGFPETRLSALAGACGNGYSVFDAMLSRS